jgi:CBS domain containing-hemolysin-like protein
LSLLPLVLVLFLAGSALCSSAEAALLGLSRYRLRHRAEGGSLAASWVMGMLERPALVLGTLLVTITTLNYVGEAAAASWAQRRLPGDWQWLALAGWLLAVVLLAEAVPISYAFANSDRIALLLAPFVRPLVAVLGVPVSGIIFAAERIVGLLQRGAPRRGPFITAAELKGLVTLGTEEGVLEEEEKKMIHSIFELGERAVREVMVARMSMIAVPEEASAQEVARVATEHRISRLPVYRGDLDHVLGVVHVRDLLPLLYEGKKDDRAATVMREPLRVPETKRSGEVFRELLDTQKSFAIVLDEYGGTAGLVTSEDLLEEIVGEIYDEYDAPAASVVELGPGSVLVDGKVSLGELAELLGQELPRGDYDTIAGLLYSRLGLIPKGGERVRLDHLLLVVEKVEKHRIALVRVIKLPEGPGAIRGGERRGKSREEGGGGTTES